MSSLAVARGVSGNFDLSSLNGSNGFVLNGISALDGSGQSGFSRFGLRVSSGGDINGDGFDDIIIGASYADPNGIDSAGQSYVVFGSNQSSNASFDLSSLNGSNGFVLNGIDARDLSGRSISNAGDINGDGFDDIIIGASEASPNDNRQAGETYVVFGSDQAFGASFDLSSIDGSNGFVLNGIESGDISGYAVSSAGDINGDGFDDIIIGAIAAGPGRTGKTYVVFGSDQSFGASFGLSSLDGSNGFVLNGIGSSDELGRSISSGDINGDGFDDIIMGSYIAGETYVVYGSNQDFEASFDLSSLDGSNGSVLQGIAANERYLSLNHERSGFSVSSEGDINDDGFDDIIIGTGSLFRGSITDAGRTYVVFGNDQGFGASFQLGNLDGSNGFILNGINPNEQLGSSVSNAGDINGDGIDDILIGADTASPNGNSQAGKTYVVFGNDSTTIPPSTNPTAIAWNTETGVVSTFGINTNSGALNSNLIGRTIEDDNWDLAATGDLDGDGRADVILRNGLSGQNLALYMAPAGQSIASEALIGRDVEDPNWSIVGTGDFNADGKTDIIWQNQAADQILAWYMDGQGGIESEALIGRDIGDDNWKVEAMADFNGDDKADMVLRNSESGQHILWEMNGSTILAESLIGRDVPDQDWHIEGAKDFDNDGTIDLFLRHRGVGQGLLWSMTDSGAIASEQLITNVPTGVSQVLV